MTVSAILNDKGYDVETVAPDMSLGAAASTLAEKRIGALVVTRGDGRIAGILSERDIVKAIGQHGAEALSMRVDQAMTAKVSTCREAHSVNEVMEIMTKMRFRHLPVERDGRLAGIISIGDVVKRRIEQVEREAEDIKAYIATA